MKNCVFSEINLKKIGEEIVEKGTKVGNENCNTLITLHIFILGTESIVPQECRSKYECPIRNSSSTLY